MRLRTTLFFTLALLSFLTKGYALSTQYEQLRVAKIQINPCNISSASAFDKRSVLARMETKAGAPFSQYEFDRDLKALAEIYDRIEPLIEEKNGELYITLVIYCKPVINEIVFLGNQMLKTKRLCKELGVQAGEIFDREKFIQAFNKLKTYYIRKGFFEAELDFCIQGLGDGEMIDVVITVTEGRAGKIKKIKICGLTHEEEVDLLQLMVTKRYRFLFSWVTGAGIYNEDMIEHDRLTILNFMQDKGYADARASICIAEDCPIDRINLTICVDKGALYRFGNICIRGNCVYPIEEIWALVPFRKGFIFSPETLRNGIMALQDLYGSCGYIDAVVDAKLILHEDCPMYDVELVISEGEQYRVGLIKVFGNFCTQTRVILHESLLCPGEIFDLRRLQGTEARLVNTGYFKSVNVYPVRGSEFYGCDGNYRDVYIEVEETDTGNLSLFAGFSTLDRIFGGVEVTECNFNAKGLLTVFSRGPRALRGGGEYVHWKANFGDKQTSYLFQWTKPYFMDTNWIVGFDVEKANNRAISHAYEIKSYGGNVHASYAINSYLKYSTHYRAIHTSNSIRSTGNPELDLQRGISGLISAIGAGINYDSTDHPRKPTRGLRSKLTGEIAGVGGDFKFFKMGYFNTYYQSLWPRGFLKFRFELQFIHTYGHTTPTTLPLGERLFLGGETTVRGYRPFIIGPKFANNEPKGGVSSLLVSEEYRHHLFSCVDGFVFIDAGYVSLSEFTLGKLRSSIGFGFNVEIIRSMPFTVGYGFPYKRAKHETQRFFFAMGGTF